MRNCFVNISLEKVSSLWINSDHVCLLQRSAKMLKLGFKTREWPSFLSAIYLLPHLQPNQEAKDNFLRQREAVLYNLRGRGDKPMCKILCCRFCTILQDFFSLSPSFTSAMKSFGEKSSEGRIEEVRKLAENSFYGAVIQFTVKKRFLCLHTAGSPIVVPNYCNFFRIANCEKVLHTKSCHQDRTKVTSSFIILIVRHPDPDPFFCTAVL